MGTSHEVWCGRQLVGFRTTSGSTGEAAHAFLEVRQGLGHLVRHDLPRRRGGERRLVAGDCSWLDLNSPSSLREPRRSERPCEHRVALARCSFALPSATARHAR
jgi:hypothetical protein